MCGALAGLLVVGPDNVAASEEAAPPPAGAARGGGVIARLSCYWTPFSASTIVQEVQRVGWESAASTVPSPTAKAQ